MRVSLLFLTLSLTPVQALIISGRNGAGAGNTTCRGAIKAGRFVALKEGQRRAAPCERAKQCELLRAVAQDTALLESNRSGAAVQRLILSKRPRVARQGGAGSSPW